jgi:RNA polymerase sigma-70 factor (ECF subfamily)
MTDCSDAVLWKELKRGDRSAFSMLYQRYVGLLYNYASRICKDRGRIEDCIQDVFVALWKYRKNLAATTSVKYYLYRALRSRIIKTAGGNEWNLQDGVRWDDMENLIDLSPEEELMSIESVDERTRKLKKSLHNLSPRQYEAIMLRFYDEFSYEEIGHIMGANPQSVRNLVARGLLQLRQYAQFLA